MSLSQIPPTLRLHFVTVLALNTTDLTKLWVPGACPGLAWRKSSRNSYTDSPCGFIGDISGMVFHPGDSVGTRPKPGWYTLQAHPSLAAVRVRAALLWKTALSRQEPSHLEMPKGWQTTPYPSGRPQALTDWSKGIEARYSCTPGKTTLTPLRLQAPPGTRLSSAETTSVLF